MSEVWELAYFGQGGFPYEQVWNMPVTSRRAFLRMISDHVKRVRAAQDEQNNVITEHTDPKALKRVNIPDHLVPKQPEPTSVSKAKGKR